MRKTKEQKGITLIALIISIIVLLILAVVAIGAVQNDGIIDHAKNARDEYSSAQTTENSTIQSYLDKIQEHVGTGSGVASGTGNGGTLEKTEMITFTFDNWTYEVEKGKSWSQWVASREDGAAIRNDYVEVGNMDGYSYLHYEDGTRVNAADDIRNGYEYSKGEKFYVNGNEYYKGKNDTWSTWIGLGGKGYEFGVLDDGVIKNSDYDVFTSDNVRVLGDDTIETRT